jgi:hypothetical protein
MNTANGCYSRYLFSRVALLCLIAVWFFHGTALSADQTTLDHPAIWDPKSKTEEWVSTQIAAGKPANLK